jgi:hypothetical protein
MKLSNEEGNDLIKKYLNEEKTFAVSRVGIGGETMTCYNISNNYSLNNNILKQLHINAGFYGDCYEDFYKEYSSGISCADIQVQWDGYLSEVQNYLFSKYSKNSIKVSNRALEPFYFDDPWSAELKNKKVLVIHPFSEKIKEQYKNKENIWLNPNILPNFKLLTYKPVQSIGGVGPHKDWKESLEIMKNDISKINFDVALLGCGSYGLPLVNYIKTILGKTSIYIGGGLQILFGIKGKRWDNHKIISNFYNENWIYPTKEDKSKHYKRVEGGCYW